MSLLKNLLGENVVNKSGDSIETSSFSSDVKYVGLYFSAHWCPPCRTFTPQLSTFYSKLKNGEKGSSFEFVFVSSDRDEAGFNEYLQTMPWPALPYKERDLKAKLSKRFKVSGIPTLVIVDALTGDVITSKGRESVTDDPDGEDFPWKPISFNEIIAGPLLRGKETVQTDVLDGKVKGLYFSAHWCPPCRAFTPQLTKAYKILSEKYQFEMVFVSGDRSEESFNSYYDTMTWCALPYGDKRANKLKSHFNIEGIPTLVLVDENNETITNNGREMISLDPEGKDFPWYPKAVDQLIGYNAGKINEDPALIFFGTAPESDTGVSWEKKMQEAMEEVASQYKADSKANPGMSALNFFYEVEEEDDLAESLRQFAQLGDKDPLLVLLDIPSQQVYISPAETITKEVVQQVVQDFKDEKLSFTGLRQ